MNHHGVGPLLEALRSPDSCLTAWAEFLECYSPVLYQTARSHASNEDAAADCYLHICERLAANGFRKLLKFKPEGSASFTTWLRVVARNLCFDWHRAQTGRSRPFKALQHLSPLEMEVYHSRLVHGSSQEEAIQHVQSLFPGTGPADLSDIEERLQRSLSSRQQWMLGTRRRAASRRVAETISEEGELLIEEVVDPRPSQEEVLADEEMHQQLKHSLALLSSRERVLIQLRYEQELSLQEVARVCGLQDAQRAHRAIAAILTKLRDAMSQRPRKFQAGVRVIGQVTRHAGFALRQSDQSR